jgi:hypothetical protein
MYSFGLNWIDHTMRLPHILSMNIKEYLERMTSQNDLMLSFPNTCPGVKLGLW